MALADDILARVRQDFSAGEVPPIIEMLGELQKENPRVFGDRILRCILFVANGRFDEFVNQVALVRIDWRDVINNAEYECSGVRLRDLTLSF